jgi:hypothetical protein
VPIENIHIEWPDNEVEMNAMPTIAFLAQTRADYDAVGLTSNVLEDTVDKYSPGTVLVVMSEYQEDFAIEIWTETKQERRSLLLGLETALSPLEQMAGLRFVMPDYYGQLVCFSLQNREVIDDDAAVINRRKARMIVQIRFQVVAPYPVNQLDGFADLTVDADDATGVPIPDDDDFPEPPPETIRPKPT